jgi:DNA-binding MarR family transcriptional regulator
MKKNSGLRPRCCVIRDGHECYVLLEALTPAEAKEVAERQRSPEARRRFGVRLRQVRRAEDAPLKAARQRLWQRLLAGKAAEE